MVKGAQWRPLSVVAVPPLQEEKGEEQKKEQEKEKGKEEQKKVEQKEEKNKQKDKKSGDMSVTETSRQTTKRRVSFTKQDIKAANDIQRYARGHAGRARAKFKSETKQQIFVIENRRREQEKEEQAQAQEEKEEEEDENNKKVRRRRQQPPRKKYQYTESPVNDVFYALSQQSSKLHASDLLRSMTSPRLIEFVRPLTRLMDSLLPTMTTASTTQDNDTSSRREVVRSSKILRSLLVPAKYQQMFQSMVQHAMSARAMEGGEITKSYLTLTDFEQMCWYGLPMETEKKNEEKKEIEKEEDEKEKKISESDKETSMREEHFMGETDCRTTRIMIALFKNILLPVNGRSYDLKKKLLPVNSRKTSANVSSQSPSKEELFTPASPASPASPTLPTVSTLPASLMVPDTSTLTTLVLAEEKSSQGRHAVDKGNIELKKNEKINETSGKKMKRNKNIKRRRKRRTQGISLESRKSAPFPEWLALEPAVTPLPPRQPPLSPSTKRHLLIKMPSPSSSSALLDTLEQEEEIMDQEQQMWVTVDDRGEMFVNDIEESQKKEGSMQDVVAASGKRYFQPPDLSRKQRRRKKNKIKVTKKKKFKKNSKKMQAGGQAMSPPLHHDSRNAGFFFEGSTDRNPLLTTHARQQQQQKTSPRVKSKQSTTLRNLMTGSNLSLYQADFMLSVLR